MTVVIRKKGFYSKDWKPKQKKYLEKKINEPMRLLGMMGDVVELEPGLTFGSFINLIRGFDSGFKLLLEMLVDSGFERYLDTIDEVPTADKEFDSELTAIEVYQYAEINNYDADAKLPAFEYSRGCHGIGKPWGLGNGNSYAIEFSPWADLKHLPLVIKADMPLIDTIWAEGKRRKIISNGGNAAWNHSDRDLKETQERNVMAPELTLYEFLEALFNEVAFFGAPASRDKQSAILKDRVASIEKDQQLKK